MTLLDDWKDEINNQILVVRLVFNAFLPDAINRPVYSPRSLGHLSLNRKRAFPKILSLHRPSFFQKSHGSSTKASCYPTPSLSRSRGPPSLTGSSTVSSMVAWD